MNYNYNCSLDDFLKQNKLGEDVFIDFLFTSPIDRAQTVLDLIARKVAVRI